MPKTQKQTDLFPETVEKQIKTKGVGFQTGNFARLVNLFGAGLWGDEPGPLAIEEALKLSSFLVCVDVLSQDIAKARLELRRELPSGGSVVVQPNEHRVARMLKLRPNKYHSWRELIEMLVLHLCAVQNAFIGKMMTPSGVVEALMPFMPGRVRILVDEESGQFVYDVERYTPAERVMLKDFERYLLPDEVIHLRGRMFDGIWGYSNLEAGSAVTGLAKALQQYQTRLYTSDATMRGVFQMKNERELSEAAFLRLKEQLRELWNNMRDKGVPLVLEEGMEFEGITMDSAAAEAAKAKDAAIEDMARLFRIPPHKMMHLGSVKYENLDTLDRSYAHDTLIPIAQKTEDNLNTALLSESEILGGYYLQFNRQQMVLYDPEKRATVHKVLALAGALTIDEMRAENGKNPLPNGAGNVRLIPANYHLVDENNEIVLETQSNTPAQPGEDGGEGAPQE